MIIADQKALLDKYELESETLKATSYDKTNNEYVSNSQIQVVNFDKLKENYIQNLPTQKPTSFPSSCDALLERNGIWYFIEFKNGSINPNKPHPIERKIYDSVAMLLEFVDKHIDYSRTHIEFILVYNENKNPLQQNNENRTSLQPNEINESNARESIFQRIGNLASEQKYDKPRFGLDRFEKFMLKKVYTVPKSSFNTFLSDMLKKRL